MDIGQRLIRLAAAAAILSASVGTAIAAQVIVVIDGSGSSAGQIGGIAKIDIARGALRSILADSPGDLAIGLVAYGHRQRENCGNIELMTPPGSTGAFLDAAARVRSVGRSPIADATVAAAAAITEDEATIVVITDNSDNCSPNPCATISALKDQTPGLTISVVGIAIPSDEVAEIACFAELTGGVYLRAETASTFEASLAEAMTLAWAAPRPPPAPMPVAAIVFPSNVVQGQVFAVDYQGPLAPGDEIRIAWAGTPQDAYITGAVADAEGGVVRLTAPNVRGAYELRYWHAERSTVLVRIPLRLDPLIPSLSAPATAQQGADVVVGWQANANGGETVQIVPIPPVEAAPIIVLAIRGEPTVTFPAPATTGKYEIRLVAGPDRTNIADPVGGVVLARAAIEIVPAEIAFEIDAPIVVGRSFEINWTGPGGRTDEIRLASREMPADVFLAIATPTGDSVRLTAPTTSGVYELRYWSAAGLDVLAVLSIEVTEATAGLEAPIEIEGGATFEVAWTGDADIGDHLAILDPAAGDAIISSVRVSLFDGRNVMEAPVKAGTYDLAYIAGAGGASIARRTIEVSTPFVTLEAPDRIEGGVTFEVAWTGPGGRFDELRLVSSDGVVVAATRAVGTSVELAAPDDPGVYLLQYWAGSAAVALASIEIVLACQDCPVADPGAELRLAPAAPRPE